MSAPMLSISLGTLRCLNSLLLCFLICVGIHLYAYFIDHYGLRRHPGPFLAKFSYAWVFFTGLTFRRTQILHKMHKHYGPVVRISPSELSFASPEAFTDLYSRTANAPKSSFYDAFATIGLPSIFATRSGDHKPRRRMMYHLFTPVVVEEFAPVTAQGMQFMLDAWERRYITSGRISSSFDCLPWCAYLTFDSLNTFLFGSHLGMLAKETDVVAVPRDTRLTFNDKENLKEDTDTVNVQLLKIIGSRETYNYFVGILPNWWKPLAKTLMTGPVRSAQLAAKFSSGMVAKRLMLPPLGGDKDLIGRMLHRQEAGKEPERAPLEAELLTLIVAGTDTTRNSLIAAMHYIARTPASQAALQSELDRHVADSCNVTFEQVKRLQYLEACINETFRFYSAVPGGLPRVAPATGMTIGGVPVVGGTTVGCHIYSIHRDVAAWGDDAELFRPERWIHESGKQMRMRLAAFKPFSDGPAACIGKNLAMVQLKVMVASVFRRFHVSLKDPLKDLVVDDWFVRHIRGCEISIQARA